MASFLESQLRNAIAKGFKGRLLTGTLTRIINGGVDEYGDPSTTTQTFRVEGFVDAYSDAYRAQAGIPETDSKITLIAGNSAVEPIKLDRIQFTNWPLFEVRVVKTDPAKATFECQSYEV
jgi:hypothetical protein